MKNVLSLVWRSLPSVLRPTVVVCLGVWVGLGLWVAAPTSAKPVSYWVHRVQPGETLGAIAKRAGLPEEALRKKNGLSATAQCRPGDTLVIPSKTAAARAKPTPDKAANPGTKQRQAAADAGLVIEGGDVTGRITASKHHVVRAGETLKALAARYRVAEERLRWANGLAENAELKLGRTLVIPLGEQVLRKPVTTSRGLASRGRTGLKPGGKSGLQSTQSDAGSGEGEESTAEAATTESEADRSNAKEARAQPSAKKVVGRLGVVERPGGLIRRAPRPDSPALWSTQPGNQLVVGGHWGEWYAVVMQDGSHCWIPKKYVRLKSTELVQNASVAPTGGNQRVVQAAMRYLGVPYRYGGNGFRGIDCSALVKAAYASVGRALPRTAASQFNVGFAVAPNQLQPGDRVYFTSGGRRIDHCGLYIGNGQMIHASGSRGGVVIENLFTPKQWAMFRGARR